MEFATQIMLTIFGGLLAIIFWFLRNNFQDIKEKFGKIETKIENLSVTITTHTADIVGIKVKVYGSANSPMRPNENGIKLLTDSGFFETYPLIKNNIFALMDAENTKTLYDSEKNAIKALKALSSKDEFGLMKNYSVNNPDENLDLIFMVASWVIRDDYAREKNIDK